MLCTSYFVFTNMYHNMQKLNKTALKFTLFFGTEYVYGGSVDILLFWCGIDNWNCYFVFGIVIGIFEVEFVFIIGVNLEFI